VSPPDVDWSARLRTLPALELLRLLERFNEPDLFMEAFFFNVPPLEGMRVSPCDIADADRCSGPSIMELPL
jgi:hypothetical protein